jgi:hypothetical protein
LSFQFRVALIERVLDEIRSVFSSAIFTAYEEGRRDEAAAQAQKRAREQQEAKEAEDEHLG